MARSNRELWLAFFAALWITAAYLFVLVMQGGVPAPSEFFGHTIGILGFVLMLMTETLYTLRKRSRSARWGQMSDWLDFHIFTGIVGPYMVLLHSSWKFNGLAGAVTLLTALVVFSGFVGRYIYTAVPRSVDGAEMEAWQLAREIQAVEAELLQRAREQPGLAQVLEEPASVLAADDTALLALFTPSGWGVKRWLRWRAARKGLDREGRSRLERLERLERRGARLRRQMNSLARARRLLAVWHAIHIPIGLALFTAAFLHILAAIYYASLLR